MTSLLKIGEVATRSGLQVSAIRYYESLGLLPVPQRIHNHRVFEASVLPRLDFIRTAQRIGFTLVEIRTLLDQFEAQTDPAALCKELVQQKLLDIERLISQAQGIQHTLKKALYCQCTTLH